MNNLTHNHFHPTLQMIAEDLEQYNLSVELSVSNRNQTYRGARFFSAQKILEPDLIYLVSKDTKDKFPTDHYCYLSSEPIQGAANHICCPQNTIEDLLDYLLTIFEQYQNQESTLNQLVLSNGTLDDLCCLGRIFLKNPVCIHDEWFVITAMSEDVPHFMPPENIESSIKGFIPRKYIDSFKYDTDYLQTYMQTEATLWVVNDPDESTQTIYANLSDDERRYGRLLVFGAYDKFRTKDFLLADFLAQKALQIIQKDQDRKNHQYHNTDEIIRSFLKGTPPDSTAVSLLLNMLNWKKNDQYICIRLQNQQKDANPVSDHLIHSDLFQLFPNSYILYTDQQQCIVLNLTIAALPAHEIHYQLSPICLEYCLYAGISSPVWGINDLSQAFCQAGIALRQAFYQRSEQWVISFSMCALDYILQNIKTDLRPSNLVAPELLTLLKYDCQKGTSYFETLRTFLLYERDIPKASEALILHRTTLIYRIKKIQSITNIDLDDPQQRLYLLLSLRLLEQEQIPETYLSGNRSNSTD